MYNKKAAYEYLHIEENSEHIDTWILRWLGICIVLVKFRKSISLSRRSKLLWYTKHIKWMSTSQSNLLHRQLINCWLTSNLKWTLFSHDALLYISKLRKKLGNLTTRNSFHVLFISLAIWCFLQISVLTYIFLFEDLEECLNEGFTPYSVVHKYLMRFYIQSGVNCWAKGSIRFERIHYYHNNYNRVVIHSTSQFLMRLSIWSFVSFRRFHDMQTIQVLVD